MKKLICFLLVVLMTGFALTACNFYTNQTDNTGFSQMEALPKVKEMMTALADGDMQTSLALMRSDDKNAEKSIDQMIRYLDGRQAEEIKQVSLDVKNTTNGSVTTRQEDGTLRVILDDGEQIYLSVCYITASGTEGFVTFQIVLGVV